VNQIAQGAVDSIRLLAEGKEVTLQVELDSSIAKQHVDPEKVRQSILHLLRNGIRFAPTKSTVRLSTAMDDDGVVIEVRDAGPPIAPEAAPTAFELESLGGSRGKRSQDGLGFGLHLAKRFVELHGGTVGAGPAPEGGSAFWMRLPRGEDLSSIVGSAAYVGELAKQ
jgi:signal transduction histidine kinase